MIDIALATLAALSWAAATSTPEGLFLTANGKRSVEIQCKDERCQGRIVKDADSPELVGQLVLKGLVREGQAWKGTGRLPRKGKEFPVTVTLPNATSLRITASMGIMRHSQDWTRVR